jgi:hypothetical protein
MNKVIALHETTDRFAIAIIEVGEKYSVARVSPDDKYLVLKTLDCLAAAKAEANRQWLADR